MKVAIVTDESNSAWHMRAKSIEEVADIVTAAIQTGSPMIRFRAEGAAERYYFIVVRHIVGFYEALS